MKELILLIISAAIVNNVVLSQFLGLCPFSGSIQKGRDWPVEWEQP